jgi:hypothetical protein
MHIIFLLLAMLAAIGSLICSLIILIDAFKDEVWKGLVSLLCGLYFLYYALAEFDHDYKWPIVLGALGGGAVSAGLAAMAR